MKKPIKSVIYFCPYCSGKFNTEKQCAKHIKTCDYNYSNKGYLMFLNSNGFVGNPFWSIKLLPVNQDAEVKGMTIINGMAGVKAVIPDKKKETILKMAEKMKKKLLTCVKDYVKDVENMDVSSVPIYIPEDSNAS